jgi:hypothetical protein
MTRPAWRASRPTGRYPLARRIDYNRERDYWTRRIPALCARLGIPAPDQPTLDQCAHVLAASYKRRGHISKAASALLQRLGVALMDDQIAAAAAVHGRPDTNATA